MPKSLVCTRVFVKRYNLIIGSHELRQKFCYPGGGVKQSKKIRCAKSDCYRGRNGQNHESEDTSRSIDEIATPLSTRWRGAQTQAVRPSSGAAGLPSQSGHSSLARAGGRAGTTDYH